MSKPFIIDWSVFKRELKKFAMIVVRALVESLY